ncbi:MAG: DUF6067 family protein [Candidatus Marinimicrobia bacterium]|nr:DUF6067 family protein [Candidatus Neomarinimicrobiota bacterium]
MKSPALKPLLAASLLAASTPLVSAAPISDISINPEAIEVGEPVNVRFFIEPDAEFDAVLVYFNAKPRLRALIKKDDLLSDPGKLIFATALKTSAWNRGALEPGEQVISARLLDKEKKLLHYQRLGRVRVAPATADPAESARNRIKLLTEEYPAPEYPDALKAETWTNTDAGRSDVVLPPWTPIQADGMSFSVWNRTYTFGDNGLPEKILSGGAHLLTEPVRLVIERDGMVLEGQFEAHVVEATDTRAVIESVGRFDGFQLRTRTRLEYDGFCYVESVVIPDRDGVRLDSLNLRVVVAKDAATHFAHSGLGTLPQTKADPDLMIASAEMGGALGGEAVTLPWSPQILLSGREQGLAVGFLDERDWRVADENAMLVLSPGAENTTLTARFADVPGKLDTPRTFRWYFNALPARPLMSWGDYALFFTDQQPDAFSFLAHFEKGAAGQAPIDKAIAGGLRMIIVHQDWTELQGYPGTFDEARANILRQVVQAAHGRGLKVVVYLARELSTAAPEWQDHAEKMVQFPLVGGRGRKEPRATTMRPLANEVFNDLTMVRLRDLIRDFDIDGVFLDSNAAMAVSFNQAAGFGYQKPDGRWTGTSNALEARAHIRRMATLLKHEEKKDGVIISHIGTWNPAAAFADISLTGEGETYFKKIRSDLTLRDLLSLDQFNAKYSPAVSGTPMLWMSKPSRGGLDFDANTAVTLQYGVLPRVTQGFVYYGAVADPAKVPAEQKQSFRSFQLWRHFFDFDPADAEWVPFWKITDYLQPAAQLTRHQAVGLHLVRGKRALLILSNLEPEAATLRFALDPAKFGFAGEVAARDPEAGAGLAFKDATLIVEVPAENYRLVILSESVKEQE